MERFKRDDLRNKTYGELKYKAESELLQLRSNKLKKNSESKRFNFLKSFEKGDSILEIDIKKLNLTEHFINENYIEKKNLSEEKKKNLFDLLKDVNSNIRKFAIRNIRDLAENSSKKNLTIELNYFDNLLKILIQTTCKQEIYEITWIIVSLTYRNSLYSKHILQEKTNFIIFSYDFLCKFQEFEQEDFYIGFNLILILSNLISDNNSENFNLEINLFSKFDPNLIVKMLKEINNLPSYILPKVLWLYSNCLKIENDNENNQPNYADIFEKTLFTPLILENICTIFKTSALTEIQRELMNFVITILKRGNLELINFLHKYLNLENRICFILEMQGDIEFYTITFNLIQTLNNIKNLDYDFLNVYFLVTRIPNILAFVEDLLIKSNNLLSGDNNMNVESDTNKKCVKLLDIILMFMLDCMQTRGNFAFKLFENNKIVENLNSIISILIKIMCNKDLDGLIENYLNILFFSFKKQENLIFIETIRIGLLDFISNLIKNKQENKNVLKVALECVDALLFHAENLVMGTKNIIRIQIEKIGLNDVIDFLRMDVDDKVADLSNNIVLDYFTK